MLPDREKFVIQLPGVPQLPQFLAYMQAHGISFGEPTIALDKLRGWKDKVVGQLTGGLQALAKQRKVAVITGTGRFTGTGSPCAAGPTSAPPAPSGRSSAGPSGGGCLGPSSRGAARRGFPRRWLSRGILSMQRAARNGKAVHRACPVPD